VSEALYGHSFVKELLGLFFEPKNCTGKHQYSPRVTRHLIENRVVSAGMVEGGLLTALREYSDWVGDFSIELTRVMTREIGKYHVGVQLLGRHPRGRHDLPR
jgi:hypothetical protein